MFRTANGTQVYLSVLNYKNVNIFESAATLSEEAKTILQEYGLATDGSENWQLFLGSLCEGGECVATISYNVDGSIAFYRNGELMLTYAAETPISVDENTAPVGTVSDLVNTMVAQVRTQGLSVVYPVSNVIVAYAADYDESKVPENCDHDFGDYNAENEAFCTICGATKIKVVTGSSSYYEMVLDPETDVVNLDPGPEWENNVASGEMTVSGDFAFRYEWDNTRDPDYWDVWIELGDAQDRWYTAPVMEPSATMLVNGWGYLYTSSTTQTVAVATLNGETLTALPAGGTADAYAGHYSALGYRVGSVFVLQVVLERVNGDVLVVTRTTEGFTKDALTVRFGGNCFFADNITSEIGTATEVEQITGPVRYPADPAITAETGLSVSFTLANAVYEEGSPDSTWNALLSAGGYVITFGNLDAFSTTGSLKGMNLYPSNSQFGGVNWNGLFDQGTIEVMVNITKNDITFFRNGMPIIKYVRTSSVEAEQNFVGAFIDAFLAEVEKNGFTFAEVAYDITNVVVGTVQETDFEVGTTDNSTGYTGEAPLWTSTIQQGQKITVTGTATSSGEKAWNAPLAYLWTGETASLNFRLDHYVNGADATPDQANGTANVSSFGFQIAKNYLGFEPDSLNAADWAPVLKEWLGKGEYDCTIVWDYTSSEQIIVGFEVVRGEESFRQQYTITPLSDNLLNTYSIGLGVDLAYYHVTGMTVE